MICCSLMPDASQARTSYTVMRIPQIQGLPPRFPGSIVIPLAVVHRGFLVVWAQLIIARWSRWLPEVRAVHEIWLRVVSYNKEARILRIWDGKCCQQPITQEVFSP